MTFPIPPSSGRLPLTDGAVRSQAHTCRTRTVFGHCSKNSTFITHSVMTLTLGGIVPILQLKKQARKKFICSLKVMIPSWPTILSPDLGGQTTTIYAVAQEFGKGSAEQLLLVCLSCSCHWMSVGAASKLDTRDHSLTSLGDCCWLSSGGSAGPTEASLASVAQGSQGPYVDAGLSQSVQPK